MLELAKKHGWVKKPRKTGAPSVGALLELLSPQFKRQPCCLYKGSHGTSWN
jgi:hypothetical protein